MADGDGTWVIDLDGVIWLAQEPIPGSADAVGRLRHAGIAVLFATNNALPTVDELVAQLAAVGIPAVPSDLVTSAQAAASMLEPGTTAVVCAGGGVREALAARKVTAVAEGPADAVVVGLTRQFDYAMLSTAVSAVRAGARLVGTNEDVTYPTPDGVIPGAGALLAAVAAGAQTAPEVAGKPHEPIVDLLRRRAPDARMVVGDRPSTDGLLARRLGVPFALVRSGVTPPDAGAGDHASEVEPEIDTADLAAVTERYLSSPRPPRRSPALKRAIEGRSVAPMPPNDGLKRYLEAGLALTQITRARAEELVHELIQAGEVETNRAQEWVEDLVKNSRERSDTLLSTVRGEVKAQLADMGITSMDDLAHRVAEVLDRAETAARKATSRGPGRRRTSARGATAKKAPARKTAAKKAPAKKTVAKKTPARKVPAKKTVAKAAAKKTAGRSSKASKARR